jgi:hypothetical protein
MKNLWLTTTKNNDDEWTLPGYTWAKIGEKNASTKNKMFENGSYWHPSWEEASIGGKTSLIGKKNNKNNVQWTMDLKRCEQVGDALHLTIKANLTLVATTYHAPFCKLALPVCKYNMQLIIAKHKAWQDGQDASHMALIESSCIYKGFTTSFLINWST